MTPQERHVPNVPELPTANTGFSGSMYLTDSEHATYLRRMPVRYAARGLARSQSPRRCFVCGVDDGTALQAAHRIPIGEGVRRWKLTPEWLDRPENLRWAHPGGCNRLVELTPAEVAVELGKYPPRSPNGTSAGTDS